MDARAKASHLERAQSQRDPRDGSLKPEPRKPSSGSRDTTASLLRRLWCVRSRAVASLKREQAGIIPCAETKERTQNMGPAQKKRKRARRTYISLGRWQGAVHLPLPVQAPLPEQCWGSQSGSDHPTATAEPNSAGQVGAG